MMSPPTIDRVVQWSAIPMIVGVGCWFADLAISSVMFVALGAMGGSFSEWRTERGLWMLGALFLTIFGAIHVLLLYHATIDWIAGRAVGGMVAVDIIVASSVLALMVRFLRAVTHWNRRMLIGQSGRDAGRSAT